MTIQVGRSARRVYEVLLALHPCGFRQCFGAEMLRDFEDAVGEFGVGWLLRDAAASLVRQRVLRWDDEAVAPEYAGLMAGGVYAGRAPHLTIGKLTVAFLLSAMLYGLIGPM